MTDEELIARLRKDDTDFWHCEAADRIKALIYEYDGRMPLAAAIGVLHLVADEIIRDHD
jgi:hypothetical protein